MLQRLRTDDGFGILGEVVEALLSALANPWETLEAIAAQLAASLKQNRFPVVTRLGGGPASELNLLVCHGLGRVPDSVFEQYGVIAADFRFRSEWGELLGGDADLVRGVRVEKRDEVRQTYSCRLNRELNLSWAVRPFYRVDWVVRSTPDGWRVESGSGDTRFGLTTQGLSEWIREDRGLIAIVADVADFAIDEMVDSNGPIRTLPYPFHHFLSLNSDVDFSTRDQVEKARQRLQEDLGLPFAGSFFLCATQATPVSCSDERGAARDRWISRWSHQGVLDTLHAFMESVWRVDLRMIDNGWQLPKDACSSFARGILVRATKPLVKCAVVAGDQSIEFVVTPDEPDALGVYHGFAQLDGDHLPLRHVIIDGVPPQAILSVSLTDFDPFAVERAVSMLAGDHVAPLLFTSHGGGHHVRALGNLHTELVARRRPEEAVCDMDRRAGPYYLMPQIQRLGVRFFSMMGSAARTDLVAMREIVRRMKAADGSEILNFRRFTSRRHQQLGFPREWLHGRNAASPSAIGFQLNDLLQRLHWLPSVHGGVLYTHFGHNVGNQQCSRLAWTEETEQAFERLASFYHGDCDANPPPFRVWVAPSASILLHALVSGSVSRWIDIDEPAVRLRSWTDDALGGEIPNVDQYGTKLLHGLTVFVSESNRTELFVDGRVVDSFTRNPGDESGRESITVVDNSAALRVLYGGRVRSRRAEGGVATLDGDVACFALGSTKMRVSWDLFPVSFLNATHWAFSLANESIDDVFISFEDARGARYGASVNDDSAAWRLSREDLERKVVLSLTGRRSHRRGFPRGHVRSIEVRLFGRPGARFEMRSVSLLRPAPGLTDVRQPRIVAGRVVSRHPGRNWEITAWAADGTLKAERHSGDFFVIRGLPPDVEVPISLVSDGVSLHSIRGRAAYTSCDIWDWDFEVV